MSRILCIGNRHIDGDDFGPRVFDALRTADAGGIDVIDGGLAGLNLLRYLDDGRPVLFVDNVSGYAAPGELVLIDGEELARLPAGPYGHAAGLPFLLQVLPQVVDRPPAQIRLLGCEGAASDATVASAAQRGLQLARELS